MDTATVPCTRCRKRRVKCDKRLPGCVRCAKSSQECPGYNNLRKFLDEGDNLRRKFANTCADIAKSNSSATAPDTTDVSSDSSLQAPTQQDIVSNENAELPYVNARAGGIPRSLENDLLAVDTGPLSSRMALDDLSELEFEATFFDIDPDVYFAEGNNCCGFVPAIPGDSTDGGLTGSTLSWFDPITLDSLSQVNSNTVVEPSEYGPTGSTTTSLDDSERETAYLVRYFVERISPCLDVFDVERYFGHVVPTKTVRSALLRNSLAAVAAKQFGKTKREGLSEIGQPPSVAMLRRHFDSSDINWFYKAASFYDKAIGYVMERLHSLQHAESVSTVNDSPTSQDASPASAAKSSFPFKRRRVERSRQQSNTADDLLAAISVFLLYELLDNRQTEMFQHMSGAHYLLKSNLNLGTASSGSPGFLSCIDTHRAWQSSFWNLACFDYIIAYTEQSLPRVDLEDPNLWEAAGLRMVQADTHFRPKALCIDGANDNPEQMTETVACRTLIWIVLKTLRYIVTERSSREVESNPVFSQIRQNADPAFEADQWSEIERLLEDWSTVLPETFEPCMRLTSQAAKEFSPVILTANGPKPQSFTSGLFPEVFYSNSMCATAVVLFHFVSSLLLLHKPVGTSESISHPRFVFKRLDAYRRLTQQIHEHAKEICAISLGLPGDLIRIHMVQPLQLAGFCLETLEHRAALVGILMEIEQETGYSTDSQLKSLQEDWGQDTLAA